MNPPNIHHIKVEKANEINLRYQKLRKSTIFFQVFEIFLVLAVISKISFQLTLALFKLSNEYFHSISLILVTPKFVFILGNAIVITLFVSSGQLNTHYQVKRPKSPSNDQKNIKLEKGGSEKQEITEEDTMMAMTFSTSEQQVVKSYRRSKSEKMRREKMERNCCGFRKSKSEMKSLKKLGCCKDAGERHYPEDHMSSEEFRKTIEDFIAKQQRLLREEEFSVL